MVLKTVGQEGKWDSGVRDQVKAGLGGSVSFGLFLSFFFFVFVFVTNQHRFRNNLRSLGLEGGSSHMLGLQVFGAMGVSSGRGVVLGVLGMVYLHITGQALLYPLLDTKKPLALAGVTGNPLFPLYPPWQLCQGSSDSDGSQPPTSPCHLC